ncbi:MAG: hypothetical protein AB1942_09930 [Pseudomonadota bacterium]
MSRNRPRQTTWPDAARMTARAFTTLFGSYAAAAGIATLLARLLPGSRVEASAWGMILSFLLFAGFGLWAFHERRLLVVAPVLWGAAAVSIGTTFLLGVRP